MRNVSKSSSRKDIKKEMLVAVNSNVTQKKKAATHSEKILDKKRPFHTAQPDSYLGETPKWLFALGDFTHDKWGLQNKKCYRFLKKLHDFEGQTWSEIQIKDKKNNHIIDVADIIKEAQERLERLNLDEDQLFSLRLAGKERLWGILRNGEFNILWYDTKHEICPSPPKHT